MNDQDKIMQFLRMSGPTLPTKVAKQLNTQILLASAHLSDLAAQGKVRISHLKVGGSPLYYLPGQEHQLEKYAAGNLNPKDVGVLNHLKEQKVLREAHVDLLGKVALRSLQDFAIPLHVTVEGKKEVFWKWRLLSEEETNRTIAQMLNPVSEPLVEVAVPAVMPSLSGNTSYNSGLNSSESPSDLKTGIVDLRNNGGGQAEVVREELGKEVQLGAEEERRKVLLPSLAKAIDTTKQKPRVKRVREPEDEFFPAIERFCKRLALTIEQKETIRRNKEFELLLKVPSAVGQMTYFCKAKEKSKCDEKDVSAAYMQAQIKKLPLLFLYTGELSKKAQEMLDSGAFENAMVRKVG